MKTLVIVGMVFLLGACAGSSDNAETTTDSTTVVVDSTVALDTVTVQ